MTQAPRFPKGKERLARVIRKAPDLVHVDDVMAALDVTRIEAAKLLARWNQQGYLRRIRRGVYTPISLTAIHHEQVLDDPWLVVPEFFSPGYVGGWSAAEHWDLTEQIFRSLCVFTTRKVRRRQHVIQGVQFVVRHIQEKSLFGTKTVWHGRRKVLVSDPHKTIVDMLADPSSGGGIEHVTECLRNYLKSREFDPSTLLQYAQRLDNGAVIKRLGFLLEWLQVDGDLARNCLKLLTTGLVKLDPALPANRVITRWRLWVPERWANKRADDQPRRDTGDRKPDRSDDPRR